MKQYRLIDDSGLFLEDCLLENNPVITDENGSKITDPHYIETPCPDGYYHPKWDGSQWVEGGRAPEPTRQTPTFEERLNAAEDALLALMGGGIECMGLSVICG